MSAHLWLRSETKEFEKRTALTPKNAKLLIDNGIKLTVEESPDRAFSIDEYKSVGCQIVKEHSWITDAPNDCYILGLKELDEEDFALKHKHIYFAHIFKGQDGAKDVFKRYKEGSGTLFDLEFLIKNNKRVAAFGYWAGYVGAALAVESFIAKKNKQPPTLTHHDSKESWIKELKEKLSNHERPKSIIIGALGRCGTGASQLLKDLNLELTPWDFEETKKGGPFTEIIEHDIFINAVLMTKKIAPFLDKETVSKNSKLSIISDVSCDPNSELNPIPIYSKHTTWDQPLTRCLYSAFPLDIIAVDNLPSALPMESSHEFSDDLTPHLLNLLKDGEDCEVWRNAKEIFNNKMKENI